MNKQNAFYPGKQWLDVDGNPIHAHGGSVVYHDDKFYWYGENKENVHNIEQVWHYGVRMYCSDDLYNWKDLGIILDPIDDISSPLHPSRIIDRPHIIYNEKTKKYIMWIKFAGDNEHINDWSIQRMGIAVSDSLTGKYELVKEFYPNGYKSGDFDLVKDEKTGDAYIYFGRILTHPSDTVCMKLTDDYMGVVEGEISTHFKFGSPPNAREAPCYFERHGKKYLMTSGTTGYHPNPSIFAVAENYHGPFTVLGDATCDKDITKSTYHSQASSIFKHPFIDDLYIMIADRWLVDLDLSKLEWITNGYRILQAEPPVDTHGLTWEEVRQYSKRDISKAAYVWLPIQFDGDRPYIKWYDSWKIDDFK